MDAKQLLEDIESGAFKNGAYIFCGEEEVYKQRAIDALKQSVELEEFNSAVLRAPSADEIIQSCEALPVMSERRLVLVYESELFKKPKGDGGVDSEEKGQKGAGDNKQIVKYLADMNPTTCLVFIGSGAPSGVNSVAKAIAKAGNKVSFDPFTDEQAARFAVDLAAKSANVLSLECARKLVFMAGADLTAVTAQTQKVCDFAGTQAVTAQMVEQIVSKTLEYTVFEMLEHFLAGRLDEAFVLLNDSTRDNVGESIKLIGFFASRIRTMYTARKCLDASFSEQKTVETIGGNPYAAKMSIKAARQYTAPQLESQIKALAKADLEGKSGTPPKESLEMALVKMFGRARR